MINPQMKSMDEHYLHIAFKESERVFYNSAG